MTRFEHHVSRGAAVTPSKAGPPGTYEIRIEDGPVTLVLRFGSAEQMAAFAVVPYAYVMKQAQSAVPSVEGRVSTGVWDDGDAPTTHSRPADPALPAHPPWSPFPSAAWVDAVDAADTYAVREAGQ